MANIRIKDLSTTAAVTASDDFIAVDGATNGTRKLNAYSPTFGGNLTVSGTGTINATTLVDASGQATSQFRVKSTANGGMLSVDAYATNNVFAGFDSDFVSPGHVARDTTAALLYKQSGRLSIFGNSGLTSGSTYTPTERVRVDLATGDMSLLSGNLTVSGTGQSSVGGYLSINSALAGSTYGRLISGTTTAGLPAFFATNAVNASLAIDFPSASVARVRTNAASEIMAFAIGTTERARFETTGNFIIGSPFTDGGQLLQVNGTAAISGALSIGNTVQTAVSVASTHKVTISIGGTTYYLLATNV